MYTERHIERDFYKCSQVTRMYVSMYVCMCVWMYLCIYQCMYVCAYLCVAVHPPYTRIVLCLYSLYATQRIYNTVCSSICIYIYIYM